MNRLRTLYIRYGRFIGVTCLIAVTLLLLSLSTIQTVTAQSSPVVFRVGKGYADNQPRQLVRTRDDRLYIFAPGGQDSQTIFVYYMMQPGLPNSSADFAGFLSFNDPGFILVVDAIYDGLNTIHLFVNNNSGEFRHYPFDITTNTVGPATLISTGNPTIPSGLYVGSNGVSGMADPNGTIHVAHWSAGNQIIYRNFSYDAATGTLTTLLTTRLDNDGQSNHPQMALSPRDNSLTVAWVSEASNPATIVARTLSATGTWGAQQQVSTAPVWTSTTAGINIDQGPNLVIDANGTRHLVYIENFDSTGDYGRVHYVTQAFGSNTWNDTPIVATSALPNVVVNGSFYSHNPNLGLDGQGNLLLVGHGPTLTGRNTEMFYSRLNANGTWGNIQLLAAPPPGDSFDISTSIRWSVVGFNRPDTVELIMPLILNGQTTDNDLYYVRFDPQGSATPVPNPGSGVPGGQSSGPAISVFDPAISKLGFLLPGQTGVTNEQIEWVVTVSNPSSVAGANLVISDELNDALRIDRVVTTRGSSAVNGQTVTVRIPILQPGETTRFSIFTTVLRGESVENTACLTADGLSAPRCATGRSVRSLPDTGYTPWWHPYAVVTVVGMGLSGLGWAWFRTQGTTA